MNIIFNIMKRILAITLAAVCICGCEKFFTPSTITLPSDGGSTTVETIISPSTLFIVNYDGDGTQSPEYDEISGTFYITCDWLTASIVKSSYDGECYTMTLTAEKNTPGNKRTLYVGGMHGNLQNSMKVIQK